ncbi:MAG: Gfo/Idh/MocA family oxidoreductase, partial [Planctomycetaceae bacterium]|nr:Gfo/Idh/MocA family oxidoreductase [Planctomycetaceae bacterium]
MDEIRSRREFIKSALLAGVAVPALGMGRLAGADKDKSEESGNGEKLKLAVIGVAAQGAYNRTNVAGENIVALCDIDANRLAEASKQHPGAKTYDDYRKLYENHQDLDGVVVCTPDHVHAFAAMPALERGIGVYCEKPLAHSVWEVRRMREAAKKSGSITQMGTQIHAGDNYRRVVEAIQGGAIGKVHRVHVWNANVVPPGERVAKGEAPAGINYDLWIGPAPYRPFHLSHFHFNWRWWWDFGGGSLADLGCHYIDLPMWALGFGAPEKVHCTKSEIGHAGDNVVPNFMEVDYHFPARGDQPAVHLTWYQGGWKPEGAEEYMKGSAILFEGADGKLLADYGSRKIFLKNGEEAKVIPESIPNSIGHHKEWIE